MTGDAANTTCLLCRRSTTLAFSLQIPVLLAIAQVICQLFVAVRLHFAALLQLGSTSRSGPDSYKTDSCDRWHADCTSPPRTESAASELSHANSACAAAILGIAHCPRIDLSDRRCAGHRCSVDHRCGYTTGHPLQQPGPCLNNTSDAA